MPHCAPEPHVAEPHELTRLLDAWSGGERAALDRLMPLVTDDLRRIARVFLRHRPSKETMRPTVLVNEAYLRLADGRAAAWESRSQFFAYAATTMRRILVNYLRDQKAAKRGGLVVKVPAEQLFELAAAEAPPLAELLDLDAALRQLALLDARQAQIVELRYFGGLSVEETAETMALSPRTVKREWRSARLFLLDALRTA